MSNKRRSFSPEFRLQCVLDVLSGQRRSAQVCREHNISASLLTRWRRHLSRNMSEDPIQTVLEKALTTGHKPEIHHPDHGSQYGAHGYCMALSSLGAQISMAAQGKAWENPYAESVIGHVKDEEIWLNEYTDFEDAFTNLCYFLDVEYNHIRIHSALGYLTPAEFEAKYAER